MQVVHRAGRRLRLAALFATLAVLGTHLAVWRAVSKGFEPWLLATDAALALVVLAAVLVHVGNLGRQRRRHALVDQLAASFSVPRNIDEAADAGVSLLVATGLADAGLVAVARADGDEAGVRDGYGGFTDRRPPLVAVAAGGFPGDFEPETETLRLPAPSRPSTARLSIARDPWLAPLTATLGERPWVAQIPLARNDELLGLLLLVSRRGGALHDPAMLETVGALFTAALDHARLYQAAFEQARDLEQQDARRREFLYAITHELRTPLTSIQAFAELLVERGRSGEDDVEGLVASLARGVDRLGTIVDDLLQLGRVEQPDVRVEIVPVDVAEAVRTAEAILRPSFMQRGQSLTMTLPNGPLWAAGDERSLEQVLINLLSNANRHTPAGGRVEVRARAEQDAVHIEVEDSGPGIQPHDRERIFQPFYRVGGAASEVPGSGLGLAVARRFTELQEGRIWVEDGADGGARFCLQLPAAPATDDAGGGGSAGGAGGEA